MSIPDIQIDYIDIVDSDSLSPISEDDLVLTKDYYIVAAVFFGAVRLIDNVRVQFPFIER